MYVDASKEYKYTWRFPTLGYPAAVDYFSLNLDYDQFVLGLTMSYGILDNLMATFDFSYGLPASFKNDAFHRWNYTSTDWGYTPYDYISGKYENWSVGVDICYRPMENLQIGVGGGVDYVYMRNFHYNGPYVYSDGVTYYTTRSWGNSEDSFDYNINFSLRYLF
jgi:hypothetical protein